MRVVFMGTPAFAATILDDLAEQHDVAAVYTRPDAVRGRGKRLEPSPVKAAAERRGLRVLTPRTLRDEAAQRELASFAPDVICVAAYGAILPKEVLDIPRFGCLNVHASLLPRWRGAAPIQWSVIAGDQKAGVTTMLMAEGLDTGDMLLKYETEVGVRETAGELFDRLAQAGAQLLVETLDRLDTITPIPQDDSQSCYAHMLDKQMAVIDWFKSAHEIDCLIRGLNPWPVALTTLDGARLKVYAAQPVDGKGKPGEVLVSDAKKGLVVACGAGALALEEIQLVGGKRMKSADFLRGHAVEKATVLGESKE